MRLLKCRKRIGIIAGIGVLLAVACSACGVDDQEAVQESVEEELSVSIEEPEEEILVGWTEDEKGKTIYIQEDGEKAAGWIKLDDELYYLDHSGHPVSGIKEIGGHTYLFDNTGKILRKPFLLDRIDEAGTASAILSVGEYTVSTGDKTILKEAIEEIEGTSGRAHKLGFIMIDIETGDGVCYNVDNEIYAASSVKGLYIPSVVANDNTILNNYENSFIQVIRNSDNNLYRNARQRFGIEPFRKWCAEAGVEEDVYSYYYPKYTPRIMAKLWVQNFFYFQTDEVGKQISEWYTSPNQSAIYATLGNKEKNKDAVTTMSKAGWIAGSQYHYTATNDGGIIYDEHPYIICITSDLPSAMDKLNPLVEALDKVHENMYKE